MHSTFDSSLLLKWKSDLVQRKRFSEMEHSKSEMVNLGHYLGRFRCSHFNLYVYYLMESIYLGVSFGSQLLRGGGG